MWKHNGGCFYFLPDELPAGLSEVAIVELAKQKCGMLAKPAASQQATQTDFPADSNAAAATNLAVATALQQDLALAKQRIAAQSVQCCFWRNKYKVLEAQVGAPRLSKSASSQTSQQVSTKETCVQTNAVQDATVEVQQFVLPGHAPMSIPKSAIGVLGVMQKHCLELVSKATNKFHCEVKAIKLQHDDKVLTLTKKYEAKLLEMQAQVDSLVQLTSSGMKGTKPKKK